MEKASNPKLRRAAKATPGHRSLDETQRLCGCMLYTESMVCTWMLYTDLNGVDMV